ncbi:hypothetical protein SLEP1_g22103 [Rubroshorea leprosula]|uniref:Histone-lysine N-methyltransferase, H3 lysine-9 specific SUVH6 n=1 Tax=Rubroshorea leprosula TaxID=152421 RepID=A0AAV5JIY9_9ROSI|nr:hypothetical protein SLEP1_g22103 [Rubroshorea leprosula]
MGVVDTMLQKESWVSFSNGSHSVGMSEKLPSEKGHVVPHSIAPPKYKRRKVCVVRDFPPGCRRNAAVTRQSKQSAPLGKTVARVKHGDLLETVRDFPPGCGPNAASVSRPSEEAGLGNTVDKEKNGDVLETVQEQLGETGLESQGTSVLKSSMTTEVLQHPNHLVSKVEKPVLMSDQVGGDGACTRKLCTELETAECLNFKISDLNNVDVAASEGKMTCLEKLKPRKYPPRRKVSAIRDFPPFCGRNALSLPEEERMRAAALQKKKSLDKEKFGKEDQGDVKQVKKAIQDGGDAIQDGVGHDSSELIGDKIISEHEELAAKEIREKGAVGTSSGKEIKVEIEDMGKKGTDSHQIYQSEFASKSNIVTEIENADLQGLEKNTTHEKVLRCDALVHTEKKSLKKKSFPLSCYKDQLSEGNQESSETSSVRLLVQGLMALSNCPWRQRKSACNSKLLHGSNGREGQGHDFTSLKQIKSAEKVVNNAAKDSGGTHRKTKPVGSGERGAKKRHLVLSPQPISMVAPIKSEGENFEETCAEKNPSPTRSDMNELDLWDKKDSLQHDGICKNDVKRHNYSVSLPPSCPSNATGETHDRNKVREVLRLFHTVCRKLLQEEESGLKREEGNKRSRIDYQAAKILKAEGKYVNTGKQIIGPVPGVEVGDEFQYFVELNIIGLHRQSQSGIDYLKQGDKILATSIIASGGYDNDLYNSDILSYMGQGGRVMQKDKPPEDQKLERGNLALANSKVEHNPVRVIRGEGKSSDSSDSRGKRYVYHGLYLVEEYKQEPGPHGKLVYKFKLVRIPGQPELAWKVVKRSTKSKVREGLCVNDISQGKELIPICAINTIDNEKPPPFEYVTSMIYPDRYSPVPPEGCDCTHGCSDMRKCSCVMKNGGEIPYNRNGAIVEAKPLVYECGPTCKCPPSCHNRVSQHGIKIQLEIFKTESRGWGVRSLNSISSGSFICEYVGELLEEKEAEQRTGNDEYLFDIGNNCHDNSLWGEVTELMLDASSGSSQVVQESGYTIDAAQKGNVGRFINHSCSPNLYAQNVLYDHKDMRIPHIMLFAAENIPPLQELTYHYNYMIDQVFDADGNVKKKPCYCGSSECTGRMY